MDQERNTYEETKKKASNWKKKKSQFKNGLLGDKKNIKYENMQ